ncbi:MAG: hypothetical protein IH600_12690 [Bacteroidetes bacterium]|nr:hypothetical protein [Bacteroidota bacterium]
MTINPTTTKILLALLALCGSILFSPTTRAQSVPEHISWTTLYEFLDELASEQIISLNTSVKPYTRELIFQKLTEAQSSDASLSNRQRQEIAFYLRAFQLEAGSNARQPGDIDLIRKSEKASVSLYPTGIFYSDSLFALGVTPVLGLQYFSNENESFYHRFHGVNAFGRLGANVGFYVSLRDNHESIPLTSEHFLTDRYGVPAKKSGNGVDYSEARGGLTVGWDWGSVGLVKDHFAWGSGYNGANIFSGRFPSPGQLTLHLAPVDWFEFNYVHAWLVSEVLDSSRSYNTSEGVYREVFHDKYLAANLYTFKPWQALHVSFGNSIIYSDIGVQAAYLVPFLFYKSVDHTLNGAANKTGQNAQMFLDISSRQIKHLNLYTTIYFDELNTRRFTEGNDNNFFSLKAGARLSNWPLKDVMVTAEYTRTNPMTYKHNLDATTFETNNYVLGHYLRDNADQIHLSAIVRPFRGLRVLASFTRDRRGPDIAYVKGADAVKVPFMEEVRFERQSIRFEAGYEVTHNGRIFAGIDLQDVTGTDAAKYVPTAYLGTTTTISGGFQIGF